ncbi:MAG: 1-acyl-sn-glycerol-3-phosphate acyltransferase [Bacteroidia bacterium]|nr:1-acyl-sn-glycerol-3-phosphate acyltransferase [Bacteroidia bacterium]
MMPNDSNVERLNNILKNSSFLDKLAITISANDSLESSEELLTEYADTLYEQLKTIDTSLIKDITFKVDDELMSNVYSVFIDNLPVFLDEKDYLTLDHLILSNQLDSALQRNYKTLLSPASIMLKKNILKDPIGISPYALKKMENLQIDKNFELVNGYIFTKDKKHLLIFLSPSAKPSDSQKNKQLIEHLEKSIEFTNNINKKANAEYFGSHAVSLSNAERIKKDVILTLSITIFSLIILLTFFFKRIQVFFLIFLPVIFGAGFSLAFIYLFKGSISAIALGAGSIVLGIAIDYSIHFYTHFKHTNSLQTTVKDLATPLTMGSVSTIGAFLSLLFVKSEALQDFGLFAALSLVGASLFTLVIFPQLLRERKIVDTTVYKSNFIEKIASYKFENNRFLIALIFTLAIISIFTSQHVSFEGDMMKMNYIDKNLAKAEQNLNNISNVSLKTVYLINDGNSLDEALIYSAKNEDILKKLENEKIISKYAGINTILLSKEEQIKRINKWNNFWTKEKKEKLKSELIEKSAKYSFKENAFSPFYELLDKTYTPITTSTFGDSESSIFNNYVSYTGGKTLLVTAIKTTADNEDLVVNSFIENEHLVVFNKKNLTNKFVLIIKNNFNLILGISSLLVLIILILSYGRLELALITYIPMMLSWLIILGLMGALGIKFNIINIIISTFIFGLGDDYSIFITDALMNEYKTGQKNLDSYKSSIFLSAFTTMIGIGVLGFAKHPSLQSIGIITIIGMFSVLLVSNTIQPALFKFLITNRTNKKRIPYTILGLLRSIIAFAWFTFGCLTLIPFGFIIIKLLPIPRSLRLTIFHKLRCFFNVTMIHIHPHVPKKYINEQNEKFVKPAIVICNHHSVIDALLMQSLNSKLILMVNDWVWNSPFMGPIVRLGGFIPKSAGYEENLDSIKKLIDNGYSLGIFPEGSRSETPKIGRFHKGAFFIAEKLNIDIVPIIFHGTAFVQGKDDSTLLKNGRVTIKYLPRILASDKSFGEDYNAKTKNISKYFKAEYEKMRKEYETVDYYFNRLSKNYIYKGPILEWYMRIKVKLEGNYKLFESLLPKKGTITDIGCGYGFLPYMLSFMSEDRIVIGTDYDEEKIAVANNCFSKTDKISFFAADATECELPKSDAFVLSDILHYLPKEEQEKLITRCYSSLNNNGMILLRDADASLEKRHWGTKYTEFISTNFGFNKTKNKLEFVSSSFIEGVAKKLNLQIQRIDNTKLTSNITYILKK